MSRRELREQIFKYIFRIEFNDRDEKIGRASCRERV